MLWHTTKDMNGRNMEALWGEQREHAIEVLHYGGVRIYFTFLAAEWIPSIR